MWVVRTIASAAVTLTPAITARCVCFIEDLPLLTALQGKGPPGEDEYTRASNQPGGFNRVLKIRNRNPNLYSIRKQNKWAKKRRGRIDHRKRLNFDLTQLALI